MKKRSMILIAATAIAAAAVPLATTAAIGPVKHPLWYKAPSAKTLELAKINDLSNTVVSDGQRGEKGVLEIGRAHV